MSANTAIQWCDGTVNPTMGCGGCELWMPDQSVNVCYAGVLHNRHGRTNRGYALSFDRVTRFSGRVAEAAAKSDLTGKSRPDKPWMDGLPRTWFVSDMSDALSQEISFEFLEREIIDVVRSPRGRRHRWLWLTKRPGRMAELARWLDGCGIPWPAQLWPGTSVTDQASVARLSQLAQVGDDTTTRFVSVEPQWGDVDLRLPDNPEIHWVIQGGQSGGGAVPFGLNQARDVLRQCREAGRAYFLKQLGTKPFEQVSSDGPGEPFEIVLGTRTITVQVSGRDKRQLGITDLHGGDWSQWPDDLWVREFPVCVGATP